MPVLASGFATERAAAQGARVDAVPPPGACWRLAFSEWKPPLDWARAGHGRDSSVTAERMRRLRDSIFVSDTGAVNSNAMHWERTAKGLQLLLFPPWWPVGVLVTFDSTTADVREMTGDAVAMVADASHGPSKARVTARNSCQ
ncbi:MAG TPA: hypothetical protein VLE53_05525 [Gemmatimonadaceae bacterium]|nr:hypothetical protein [Gemmatimonadaceae bacterium]